MKHLALSLSFFMCLLWVETSSGKERSGYVEIKISLIAPEDFQSARIWMPYPFSSEHQFIEEMKIKGNFIHSAVYREPKSGAFYLFAEWAKTGGVNDMILKMSFKATSQEQTHHELNDMGEPIPVEVRQYQESTWWVPTEGRVKEIAEGIVKNKMSLLQKARAVYDWVIENTRRDPNVRGCGLGIVEVTLAKRSGKCADLSSVYVALARNIGVPAREVFGLRLGRKNEENITNGYHCWAEFYLPGTGWVPVDPSDVRKIMLGKQLGLDDVKEIREYYFGNIDEYRIILERGGRGILFQPSQENGPVNYLMYPYVEINGQALDYFDPENFRYSVYFKKM